MKKMLAMLSGIALLGSASASVVSCGMGNFNLTPPPVVEDDHSKEETKLSISVDKDKIELSKAVTESTIEIHTNILVEDDSKLEAQSENGQFLELIISNFDKNTLTAKVTVKVIGEPQENINDSIILNYHGNEIKKLPVKIASFKAPDPSGTLSSNSLELSNEKRSGSVTLKVSNLVGDLNTVTFKNSADNSYINVLTNEIDKDSKETKITFTLKQVPTEDITETISFQYAGFEMGSVTIHVTGYVEEPTEPEVIVDETITSEFDKNIFKLSSKATSDSATIRLSNVLENYDSVDIKIDENLKAYINVSVSKINYARQASVSVNLTSEAEDLVSGSIKVSYAGKTMGEIGVNILPEASDFKSVFSKDSIRVAKNNWSDSIQVSLSKTLNDIKELNITSNLGDNGYVKYSSSTFSTENISNIDLSVERLPENVTNEILTVEYAGVIIGKITIDLFQADSSLMIILSTTKVILTDTNYVRIDVLNHGIIKGELTLETEWNEYFDYNVSNLISYGYFSGRLTKIPNKRMEFKVHVKTYTNAEIEEAVVTFVFDPENLTF